MNRQMWVRLGIALTATWLVLGGLLAYRATEAELPVVSRLVQQCLDAGGSVSARQCGEHAATARESAEASSVLAMAQYIGLPVLVGWILGAVFFIAGDRALTSRRARPR